MTAKSHRAGQGVLNCSPCLKCGEDYGISPWAIRRVGSWIDAKRTNVSIVFVCATEHIQPVVYFLA